MLVSQVSVGGYSGCFCPLVTNTSMYVGAQCLLESLVSILLGMYLEVALLDQVVILLELNIDSWDWLSRRKQNTLWINAKEGHTSVGWPTQYIISGSPASQEPHCMSLLDKNCLGQSWFPQKVLCRVCLLSYLPSQFHPAQDIRRVVTTPLPTSLSHFKT